MKLQLHLKLTARNNNDTKTRNLNWLVSRSRRTCHFGKRRYFSQKVLSFSFRMLLPSKKSACSPPFVPSTTHHIIAMAFVNNSIPSLPYPSLTPASPQAESTRSVLLRLCLTQGNLVKDFSVYCGTSTVSDVELDFSYTLRYDFESSISDFRKIRLNLVLARCISM
jgi:hypothetical protein